MDLTPSQRDALRHFAGVVVLREMGGRWFPPAGTIRSLIARGLLEPNPCAASYTERFRLTEAGREMLALIEAA